jgi:hypothetical protein
MIQMPKASQAETQARLRKENAERQAKMAEQKAKRLAAEAEKKKQVSGDRLKDIGREIKARVGKLDQLGGKTVDMIDSIDHLLADAEKLCDPAGFTFEAGRQAPHPILGQSDQAGTDHRSHHDQLQGHDRYTHHSVLAGQGYGRIPE